MFDLPGYIEYRLARAGVARRTRRPRHGRRGADFFSYRRACLRGEGAYGRALSAIACWIRRAPSALPDSVRRLLRLGLLATCVLLSL